MGEQEERSYRREAWAAISAIERLLGDFQDVRERRAIVQKVLAGIDGIPDMWKQENDSAFAPGC